MSATLVDTSYRNLSLATLQALRLSMITQLGAVQGTGQAHSANGRQTTLSDFDTLTQKLVSIDSAIEWKGNPANAGNNGYASRYSSFGGC